MHRYFTCSGDPHVTIIRRVTAIQHAAQSFMMMSFHVEEEGDHE